ncbi:MAG: BCCT family transporter [Coriobacteriales bacterium]|jgi:glycine betaine transporter
MNDENMQTTGKLEKDAVKRRAYGNVVFAISLGIVVFLVVICAIFPDGFYAATTAACDFVTDTFGWYYLLLVTLIIFGSLIFIFSPIGAIHLGDPGSKPEYSTISWIAMLFSAGMGIGLIFWGSAQPLSFYASSAPEAPVGSQQALLDAFKYSFFHWGISAWTIYALVALAIAYFRFRKKETFLLSSTLKPLFGDRVYGWLGKLVDVITTLATILGVATSLGLGAMQINGGLSYLFGVPNCLPVQIGIIIVTTCCFIASAVSGIGRGLKHLSNINVILACCLMAICMVVGPANTMLNTFVDTLGTYMQDFLRLTLHIAPFDSTERSWIGSWTIFYWAWWIAWSPFVGIFIARISRGRTIRQFVVGVILVPAVFSFLWFSVFGVLSTNVQMNGFDLTQLATEEVLFGTLSHYPLGFGLSILAIILVFTFFITSADSATFVLGMISEGGTLNPRNSTKVIWGIMLAAISIVLLMAGGLNALQNVLILGALPFSVVLILMMVSLMQELIYERYKMGLYIKPEKLPERDRPFRSYEEGDEKGVPAEVVFEAIRADRLREEAVAQQTEADRDQKADDGLTGDSQDSEEGASSKPGGQDKS